MAFAGKFVIHKITVLFHHKSGAAPDNATIGRSIGQFFNVHDEQELEGWQRAGTLPRNRYAMGYSPVAAQGSDPAATELLGNRQQEQERRQQDREEGGRRQQSRLGRVTDTLTRAIPGRRKRRDPTREEVMKTLPKFWPVVTVVVALLEVTMLVAVIVTGGLAPIKFTPETEYKVVTGFDNQSVSADRQIVPNFFIGTSKSSLVHAGGMYTPVRQHSACIDSVNVESIDCNKRVRGLMCSCSA